MGDFEESEDSVADICSVCRKPLEDRGRGLQAVERCRFCGDRVHQACGSRRLGLFACGNESTVKQIMAVQAGTVRW
jgi:hypothetical protein